MRSKNPKAKPKKRRRRDGGRAAAAGTVAGAREYISKAPKGGDEAEGADTSGGGAELALSAPVWMIALMEPVLIGLMGPLETPSNQGLGKHTI